MISTSIISESSSPYINLGKCTKTTNYNWYNRHFHVPQFSFIRDGKVQNSSSSLFCWLLKVLVVWPRLDGAFVSHNTRGVCVSYFQGQMQGCAYAFSLHDQISISSTILSRSPCLPCHVIVITVVIIWLLHWCRSRGKLFLYQVVHDENYFYTKLFLLTHCCVGKLLYIYYPINMIWMLPLVKYL